MDKYEYIRLYFDPGDLEALNGLGAGGWVIVAVLDRWTDKNHDGPLFAVLSRKLPSQ